VSFRFRVESVATVAGVVTINGMLEAGTIRHNDVASVMDQPDLSIIIRTVAFVNSKKDLPSTHLTLTIKPTPYPVAELVGRVLQKRAEG